MARKLPIPNGRLDGALDANGQRIVNLVDPMSGDDAATKAYVDASDAASAVELGKQVDAALGGKQDKLDANQLAAVNSGITSSKLANMVTKSDVVPLDVGSVVIARIGGKEIKAPAGGGGASDFISDADGNVINADRSVTVNDGTWTCEGVVLQKISGGVWQDDESGYAIGAAVGGRWIFTPDRGQTFGFCEAPDDAKELTFEVGGRTYSAKFGRSDSLLTKADVQLRGDGTEVIAVIGGKEIKAPAGGGGEGTVRSVANVQPTPDGNVPLTAADVGALPKTGGGVGTSESAGVLTLMATYDTAPRLKMESAFNAACSFDVPNSGKFDATGEGPRASLKKGGKEVATEEQVGEVSGKVDEIKEAVSTDNRLLVSDTTAAIQTHDAETDKWSDEVRLDKGYDALTGDTVVKLDKSVQTVTVGGSNLEIVLPDAVSGTVRDFCVYANNSGDADTALTFPPGTYYGDDPNGAVAKAGKVTGIYLSEIPNGVWTLGIRELEQHEVTA